MESLSDFFCVVLAFEFVGGYLEGDVFVGF